MAKPNRPGKGKQATTSLAIGPVARKKKKDEKRQKALRWLTNGDNHVITARKNRNRRALNGDFD